MRPTRTDGMSVEHTSPMPLAYPGTQSPVESDDKTPPKRESEKKIQWVVPQEENTMEGGLPWCLCPKTDLYYNAIAELEQRDTERAPPKQPASLDPWTVPPPPNYRPPPPPPPPNYLLAPLVLPYSPERAVYSQPIPRVGTPKPYEIPSVNYVGSGFRQFPQYKGSLNKL